MITDKEIKKVESQIWDSMDHLRSMGLQSDSYDVILFLLVLKRKNLLPKFNLNPTEQLVMDIELAVKQYDNSDLELCFNERYKSLVQYLGMDTCNMILTHIQSVDLSISDLNFQKVFESFLYNFINAQGRQGGEALMPKGLANFMMKQVNLTPSSKVYNPFAGYGTFGIQLDNNISCLGQEIVKNIWALGVLRGVVHGKNSGKLIQGDSIENWINHSKFDLIISAPPLGPFKRFTDSRDTRYRSCDEFVISKGLESLNTKGKLVVLVANSFLFNHGIQGRLRKDLVEKDLIERIISLPAGLLNNTGVKTSILVLNKNKDEKDIITLIDTADYVIPKIKDLSLKYDDLLQHISDSSEAEGFKKINRNEIDKKEYSLEIGRYFLKEKIDSIDDENLIKLNEILEDVSGERTFENANQKEISIKDLLKDNLDYVLKINELEVKEGKIRNARLIAESCLLVAKIGNDLKPTYFEFQGEKLAVSNNVMAFKIKDLNIKIDLDYLINELHSDFVLKQLSSYRRGVAQKMISKKDFLMVAINIPVFDSQKQIMVGVKEAFIKSRQKEFELQKQLIGYKDEAFREFASIKHTFRQYLNALKSNVSGTRKFVLSNQDNSISLETIYSKNLNRTFGEHLTSLEGTINSMNHLLNSFEANSAISEGEKEKNDLIELIKECQNRFKNPEIFSFEKLYVDDHSFIDFSGYRTHPAISFNKEDFFKVFSNIVSNAKDHGFKNQKSGNKIRCSLSHDIDKNEFILEISNNGEPFPDSFLYKELITKGEKTSDSLGSGMGGADIKAILNYYDASFEIVNDSQKSFPVMYVLRFPNKPDVIL